jgi:hypothetical protein
VADPRLHQHAVPDRRQQAQDEVAKRKAKAGQVKPHEATPLTDLFLTDDDNLVWEQLELRHVRLDKLAKRALGHEAAPSEPQGLTTAAEDDVDDAMEEMVDDDSDDSFEEDEDSEHGELESEFSDSPANESIQPLNGTSPPSNLVVRLRNAPKAALKPPRRTSEVDDDFFNLNEFHKITDAGEEEMQRLMEGGEEGEQDEALNQGIDMFAPIGGPPKDTLMDGSEDGEDDGDMNGVDLQDVAGESRRAVLKVC